MSGEDWRISVVANKRWERFRVEKETRCRKWRHCQPTNAFERNAPPSNPCGPSRDRGSLLDALYEEACTFSFERDDPSFNAPIYANLFDNQGGRDYPPRVAAVKVA
jgi:hypothetical protein